MKKIQVLHIFTSARLYIMMPIEPLENAVDQNKGESGIIRKENIYMKSKFRHTIPPTGILLTKRMTNYLVFVWAPKFKPLASMLLDWPP